MIKKIASASAISLVIVALVMITCVSTSAFVGDIGALDYTTYVLPDSVSFRVTDSTSWVRVASNPYGLGEAYDSIDSELQFDDENDADTTLIRSYSYPASIDGAYAVHDSYETSFSCDRIAFRLPDFAFSSAFDPNSSSTLLRFTVRGVKGSSTPNVTLSYDVNYYNEYGRVNTSRVSTVVRSISYENFNAYYDISSAHFERLHNGYEVLSYSNIRANTNFITDITSVDFLGKAFAQSGLTERILPPNLPSNVDDANPLSWLTTFFDGLFNQEVIPEGDGFPSVTVGGILSVIIAVPLLVAFLKLFAGG